MQVKARVAVPKVWRNMYGCGSVVHEYGVYATTLHNHTRHSSLSTTLL